MKETVGMIRNCNTLYWSVVVLLQGQLLPGNLLLWNRLPNVYQDAGMKWRKR